MNKGILLIEDNPDDAALAVRAFRKLGLAAELTVRNSGEEALDYLLSRAADEHLPSLVLLDLQLPRMSGLDVLKAMRDNDRTRLLPVVVMTSSDEERDIQCSYRLGANSYLRKPVEFAEFTEVVGQLQNYWLTLNRPPGEPRRAV